MKATWKKVLLGALVIGGPALAYTGCKAGRAGYESAGYSVLSSDAAFEIREYEPLALVSAPMPSANDKNMNQGFGKLFKYITGNNESNAKIAMTTPVFIDPGDENNGPSSMSFVLPSEIPEDLAPNPNDELVTLSTMRGGGFASYRFNGSRTRESEQSAIAELRSWMDQNELKGTGSPQFAYYDPPWTPSFLRRNEVLIRLIDS
jgi:hypothetical protein